MKTILKQSHVLFFLLFLATSCLFAQTSPEVQNARDFLAHLEIEPGADSVVTNSWNVPTEISVSNETVFVDVTDDFGTTSGSLLVGINRQRVGTYEVSISCSIAAARTYWALRHTANSMPPTMYFNNYCVQRDNRGCLFVRQSFVDGNGVTNIVPSSITLLYQNAECTVFSETLNVKDVAIALLRAGGVNIPDEPAEPPSNPRR